MMNGMSKALYEYNIENPDLRPKIIAIEGVKKV
jgi:hypothetical protein